MLRGFALHYNMQFCRWLSVTNSEKFLINSKKIYQAFLVMFCMLLTYRSIIVRSSTSQKLSFSQSKT